MDGRGRFLDNIFIERLWRRLKYEGVYLHAWETGSAAKARWLLDCGLQPQAPPRCSWRPHPSQGLLAGKR